jgi:hypothetical protein
MQPVDISCTGDKGVFLGGGGCTGEIQGAKEKKKPNVSKHVWWRSPTRVALLEYLLTNVQPLCLGPWLALSEPQCGFPV